MLKIALVHPDIPQNTGNIARLCVGVNAELHLVHPLGFVLDEKKVKRAGLDYWPHLKLVEHENLQSFLSWLEGQPFSLFTTKTKRLYTSVSYEEDHVLVFGAETTGLPEDLLAKHESHCVTLPMLGQIRSLNLSNAVAVGAYEQVRQVTRL